MILSKVTAETTTSESGEGTILIAESGEDGGGGSGGGAALRSQDVLLAIPISCCVTFEVASQHAVGAAAICAVTAAAVSKRERTRTSSGGWHDKEGARISSSIKSQSTCIATMAAAAAAAASRLPGGAATTPTTPTTSLWMPSDRDLILAMFLAADAADPDASVSKISSPFEPYYATLPDNAEFDVSLPRRWDEKTISALLAGSSSSAWALQEKAQVQIMYNTIVKHWPSRTRNPSALPAHLQPPQSSSSKQPPPPPPPPPFERFDWAIAIVDSRGFVFGKELADGDAEYEGLVPLVDLMNHSSARNTTFKLERNNTPPTPQSSTGQQQQQQGLQGLADVGGDNDGDASCRSRSEAPGPTSSEMGKEPTIVVRAARDFSCGDELFGCYGAHVGPRRLTYPLMTSMVDHFRHYQPGHRSGDAATNADEDEDEEGRGPQEQEE
eukprot:gene12671-20527_t